MDIMNTEPNDASSETTPQRRCWVSKSRSDPKQMPLIKLLKFLKLFERRDSDIPLVETYALHAAWIEFDSVGQFALHILNRVKTSDTKLAREELYLDYCEFCVANKWHPHRQQQFAWILRLEVKTKTKQLPLIKLFKLLKLVGRRDSDISTAEAYALHASRIELNSVSQFALHILTRDAKLDLDELYLDYCQFCVAKNFHPHRKEQFEWMLLLEVKTKAAPDSATTTAA